MNIIPESEEISIHAPREGGDVKMTGGIVRWAKISIHAPREGGDWQHEPVLYGFLQFQSTPPARGATLRKGQPVLLVGISIHAPREGGDGKPAKAARPSSISIHAPREGGDRTASRAARLPFGFQSTPPARGATGVFSLGQFPNVISIHAPREGGDGTYGVRFYVPGISIHAPREGGDNVPGHASIFIRGFQSTPPARGATDNRHSFKSPLSHFNPRPPRGGRPPRRALPAHTGRFQSTPPARGATSST